MPRHCPWNRPKAWATTASAGIGARLDAGWDAGVDPMGACARIASCQHQDFKPATSAARMPFAPARALAQLLAHEGLNRSGVQGN